MDLDSGRTGIAASVALRAVTYNAPAEERCESQALLGGRESWGGGGANAPSIFFFYLRIVSQKCVLRGDSGGKGVYVY